MLISGVLAVALGSSYLALDLGLISLPSRSLATEPRLETGGEAPHPLERFVRPPKRLLASPHRLATRAPRLNESVLALVGEPLPLVRDPLPLVRDPLPLVREPLALIGDTIAFVCTTLSLSKLAAQPLKALSVRRHCFSITSSDASTSRQGRCGDSGVTTAIIPCSQAPDEMLQKPAYCFQFRGRIGSPLMRA